MKDWNKNSRPDYRTTRLKKQAITPSADRVYYDNADMMRVFSVTGRTLQRWRRERIIPFKKLGGKIYYLAEEVEELMRNGGTTF